MDGGESIREGGGIMCTSASGQGGGPRSRYVDAQPENIVVLVGALSAAGTALDQGTLRQDNLIDALFYLKNAVSVHSASQTVAPMRISLEEMQNSIVPIGPNQTKCLTCPLPFLGLPALRTGPDGRIIDTLRPNANGGVDTFLRVRKRN